MALALTVSTPTPADASGPLTEHIVRHGPTSVAHLRVSITAVASTATSLRLAMNVTAPEQGMQDQNASLCQVSAILMIPV